MCVCVCVCVCKCVSACVCMCPCQCVCVSACVFVYQGDEHVLHPEGASSDVSRGQTTHTHWLHKLNILFLGPPLPLPPRGRDGPRDARNARWHALLLASSARHPWSPRLRLRLSPPPCPPRASTLSRHQVTLEGQGGERQPGMC
jgi:hypothetical protein